MTDTNPLDTGVTPATTGRAADPSRWGGVIVAAVVGVLASGLAWAAGADTARDIVGPGLSAVISALGLGELVRGTSTKLTRAVLGSNGAWSPVTVEREYHAEGDAILHDDGGA